MLGLHLTTVARTFVRFLLLAELLQKRGNRVEILDEATCSQTMINEETGESSTFSTGLLKFAFHPLITPETQAVEHLTKYGL
ncbi:MAG: hypothetical protein CM1200mP7_0040 [Chloroflexota bacterium]|nr:MAG: hypothetical protein CM1200mP7_0040 [Chloroflexota bacterium]